MAVSNSKMVVIPIGAIQTPYTNLADCPRNIGQVSDECLIALFEDYRSGLDGLHPGDDIQLLYWLDKSTSSEMIQQSRKSGEQKSVFALRTPNRPNPVGTAEVTIEAITEAGLTVRGLDCLSGTPLIDIKPAFKG